MDGAAGELPGRPPASVGSADWRPYSWLARKPQPESPPRPPAPAAPVVAPPGGASAAGNRRWRNVFTVNDGDEDGVFEHNSGCIMVARKRRKGKRYKRCNCRNGEQMHKLVLAVLTHETSARGYDDPPCEPPAVLEMDADAPANASNDEPMGEATNCQDAAAGNIT